MSSSRISVSTVLAQLAPPHHAEPTEARDIGEKDIVFDREGRNKPLCNGVTGNEANTRLDPLLHRSARNIARIHVDLCSGLAAHTGKP